MVNPISGLRIKQNKNLVYLMGNSSELLSCTESFFLNHLKKEDTRKIYFRVIERFASWCKKGEIKIAEVQYRDIEIYIEEMQDVFSSSTVSQNLAAIRMLYDWLMIRGFVPANPVPTLRNSKKQGKASDIKVTEEVPLQEVRQLIDSFQTNSLVNLRDRAIICTILYTFTPVESLINLRANDYFKKGPQSWLRLRVRGNSNDIPVHEVASKFLDEYLKASSLWDTDKILFPTINRYKQLSGHRMANSDCFKMVRRVTRRANLPPGITPSRLRVTGIRSFMRTGASPDKLKLIAGYLSQRSTQKYQIEADVHHSDLIPLFEPGSKISKSLEEFVRQSGIFQPKNHDQEDI